MRFKKVKPPKKHKLSKLPVRGSIESLKGFNVEDVVDTFDNTWVLPYTSHFNGNAFREYMEKMMWGDFGIITRTKRQVKLFKI